MNEKEKENVKEEEEEEEEEGIWVREQRKRKRKRSKRRRGEEQLADRLDLASVSDGGQQQRQRAEVRGQTSVIFLSFFHCWRVRAPSEPCQSRVGEAKKKKKKKRHSPDTGIKRVVPVPMSDTDTTPKMACPCNLDHKPYSCLI